MAAGGRARYTDRAWLSGFALDAGAVPGTHLPTLQLERIGEPGIARWTIFLRLPLADDMHSLPHADETIELQQKLARVQSLLEASRRVHATIRLEDVLASVVEIAAKELEADGAFFVVPAGPLVGRSSVFGQLPDSWTRWTGSSRLPGYSSAKLLDESGGTLAHLVIYRSAPLSFEEEDFLEGLALQSALAVGNAQHHERMLEWKRVQADLDAARAIQRSLLPQSMPEIAGYSLNIRSTACYEVGGDYVDVMPLPDGHLMMVIADVAGKGMASALMSMTFRSSFRAISSTRLPLEEMAARLNTLHWQEGAEARRRYVTAILLYLDPHTHVIEAVNAGHNPAFLVAPDGSAKIETSGLPLGMLPTAAYEKMCLPLPEGSRLLAYTDGLTEVFSGEEEFGEDRLLALVEDPPESDFLDYVWTTLAEFVGNARQTDDMTALYVCRLKSEPYAR